MLAGRRPAWMDNPYSMDLRERMVAAVDKGGLSYHRAMAQFGVGVNTAILWARRFRETGSRAGPDGQPHAEEDFGGAPRLVPGAHQSKGLHVATACRRLRRGAG